MGYRANTEIVNYCRNDSAHIRLHSRTPCAGDESFSDLLDDLEKHPSEKDSKATDTSNNALQSQHCCISIMIMDSEQNTSCSSENSELPELRAVQLLNTISLIVQYDELSTDEDTTAAPTQLPLPIDIVSFDFPLKIELLPAVPDAKIGQAIAGAIHHAYRNKIYKVSVAINPPQFGNLDIELIFAGTQIKKINITTTTEEALRVLTGSISIPALSNTLAESFGVQEKAIELHLDLRQNNSNDHHDDQKYDQQLPYSEPEIITDYVLPVLLPVPSGVDIIV